MFGRASEQMTADDAVFLMWFSAVAFVLGLVFVVFNAA